MRILAIITQQRPAGGYHTTSLQDGAGRQAGRQCYGSQRLRLLHDGKHKNAATPLDRMATYTVHHEQLVRRACAVAPVCPGDQRPSCEVIMISSTHTRTYTPVSDTKTHTHKHVQCYGGVSAFGAYIQPAAFCARPGGRRERARCVMQRGSRGSAPATTVPTKAKPVYDFSLRAARHHVGPLWARSHPARSCTGQHTRARGNTRD